MSQPRFLTLVALLFGFLLSLSVSADPNTAASTYDDSANYGDSQGYGRGRSLGYPGILADILLLRPTGLVLTVAGAAAYLGVTPLTAIADAAPPHDAFERVGTMLVGAPFAFTFKRPLGEMNYQRDGVYPTLTRPEDRPLQGPIPLVTRTEPAAASNTQPTPRKTATSPPGTYP